MTQGTSMKEKNKQLIPLMVMLTIVGLLFYGFHYIGNKQAKEAQIAREVDRQVSIIPSGTEEAWQAFIDRRVAAVLRREGRLVKLDDDTHRNIMEQAIYVSLNVPYQISCTLKTATVQFGATGDNSQGMDDGVEFFNVYLDGDRTIRGHTAEKAPSIGIPPNSIAAATLRDHVCLHLANKVQAAFSDGDSKINSEAKIQ